MSLRIFFSKPHVLQRPTAKFPTLAFSFEVPVGCEGMITPVEIRRHDLDILFVRVNDDCLHVNLLKPNAKYDFVLVKPLGGGLSEETPPLQISPCCDKRSRTMSAGLEFA
eukprot:5985581-Prymnesium_polylepis.1